MEKAEDTFKRKNWYYSEYDNEWYEDYTDITCIHIWNESEGIYEDKKHQCGYIMQAIEK